MGESNHTISQKRSANPAADAPLDDVFDVLADQRRRNLLRHLLECDPPVSVTEIAEALQSHGHVGSVEERRKLRISIHHVHLPKLDERGVLDYDAETNRVVGWSRIESMEPYLDIAETLER